MRPRILAIDDTLSNLLTLGAALASEVDLQVATSGAQGLALAAASPPDLILLDIMMPEMDGLEVCRRFKADPLLKHIPIVFITALTESDTEVAALALGGDDFITKPINVMVARQRINNLLDRSRLRKENEKYQKQLEQRLTDHTLALSGAREAVVAANHSKKAFLASVGHGLRAPMNTMMAYNALAMRRTQDEKTHEYLQKTTLACHTLLHTINNILDMTHLEAEQLVLEESVFCLSDVLASVLHYSRPKAEEKSLPIHTEIPANVLNKRLLGDGRRFIQILSNLVDNAVSFTEAGSVLISMSFLSEAPEENVLHVSVEDTGSGISEEDLPYIFTPFEQINPIRMRNESSIGVGLVLCERLLKRMGGEIYVKSTLGRGSVFSVTVRFKNPPEQAALVTLFDSVVIDAETRLRTEYADARLLLVSSDRVKQEAMSGLLAGVVGRVEVISALDAAIERVGASSYDLVWVDIDVSEAESQREKLKTMCTVAKENHATVMGLSLNLRAEPLKVFLDGVVDVFAVFPLEASLLYSTILRALASAKEAKAALRIR